jgi:hypothetical protein
LELKYQSLLIEWSICKEIFDLLSNNRLDWKSLTNTLAYFYAE